MRGIFISGTATGVGKTWIGRGLSRALFRRHIEVLALKPIETGCDPVAADAHALARACRHPELADDPEWFRAKSPVAPYAATLAGAPTIDMRALVRRLKELSAQSRLLVEGAGGLLVPLTASQDFSHLARALRCPILLVARDELGVLSHVLAHFEAAQQRGLEVLAVVLTPGRPGDPSTAHNAAILGERLEAPILRVAAAADDDDDLATAIEQSGLADAVTRRLTAQ